MMSKCREGELCGHALVVVETQTQVELPPRLKGDGHMAFGAVDQTEQADGAAAQLLVVLDPLPILHRHLH